MLCVQQYQVEIQAGNQIHNNFIRCKGAIIDYMLRPFFIKPSSGLAWRSKEELVQLYKVERYIIWVKLRVCGKLVPLYYAMLDLMMAL